MISGDGYCTDKFFSRCPHRLACVRCRYYLPKESAAAKRLEADSNNERILIQLPLREDERAAIEADRDAWNALQTRLESERANDGRLPAEIRRDEQIGPARSA
jgi:hypothetical protein